MSDFEINWKGNEFLFKAGKVTKAAMKEAAFEVEREAKLSFGTGASSPDTTVRRGEKRHRSSAEGFPPNVDFGILKSSVDTKVENITEEQKKQDEVIGLIGYDIEKVGKKIIAKKGRPKNMKVAVEYGFFLEVGTKNMRPRPWLLPALRKASPKILKIFRKAVL